MDGDNNNYNKLLNSPESAEEYIEFHEQVNKKVEALYKGWISHSTNL